MNDFLFEPEEYQIRRQALAKSLPGGGLILLPGAPHPISMGFRQYNEFHYFTGLEQPGAYLLMETETGRSTLVLPPQSRTPQESTTVPLHADDPERACAITGIESCTGMDGLMARLSCASLLHFPFFYGEGRGISRSDFEPWIARNAMDPIETSQLRSHAVLDIIRSKFPYLQTYDVGPEMAKLRVIKSPREIEALRRAGALTARGVVEAMRSTRPGIREYQLDAVMRYHFLAGGAADRGYESIIPCGPNIYHGHYHENRGTLTDGDWLLCDGAAEYHYYTSDIGRMWPVNGRYSPVQRALYGYVVECEKILLSIVRAGRTVEEIDTECDERLREVARDWDFVDPKYKNIASTMHGRISHAVGMSVHDGSDHFREGLRPGMVISLDPSLRDPETRTYVRVEDTVVVTETGVECLTAAAPLELDDMEKEMENDGLLQMISPLPVGTPS